MCFDFFTVKQLSPSGFDPIIQVKKCCLIIPWIPVSIPHSVPGLMYDRKKKTHHSGTSMTNLLTLSPSNLIGRSRLKNIAI